MPHDRELRLLRGCRTALDELMHDIVLDDLPLSDFSKVYLYALDRLLADLEHDLPRRLAA